MNYRLLFQWIPLTCIIILLVAGAFLKQKNTNLDRQNKKLVLQNDSILSVNIELLKQMTRLKESLDSLRPQ